MTTDQNQREENVNARAVVLRVIALLVLFPVLWIGVTVNFFDLAKRISFLPGISEKGGVGSGITALVISLLVLVIIVGGVVAASGAELSGIGGQGGPPEAATATSKATPTSTATTTPALTPTATPTVTVKPTPTVNGRPMTDLEKFEADYRDRLNKTLEQDRLTGVPVLGSAYRQTKEGKTVLWLVFWECDPIEPKRHQWVTIANYYLNTVGAHLGEQPDRVQIYAVVNHANQDDTISHITTESAEGAYNGTISPKAYTDSWFESQRVPTQSESDTAYDIAVNESGQALADEAFNEHHPDVQGCPGGAEMGTGESGDETPQPN